MSVTSGFFNSKNHDRRYSAVYFSKIFNGIINDGVFMNIGTSLIPKADGTNTIYVGVGRAWFNGTWTENDSVLPIEVPISDIIRPRIDALVLEVNNSEAVRNNSIKIIQGTPGTSPEKPELTITEDIHQHALAYITRRANDETVNAADLEIMIGTESCPFVTGILQTVSITELLDKWQDELDQFVNSETSTIHEWFVATQEEVAEWISGQENSLTEWINNQQTSFTEWKETQQNDITEWTDNYQADFVAWYNSMKGLLTEDYAGKVQVQLDEESIRRYMTVGFEDGTKTLSNDGRSIVSVSSKGLTIEKTFSNDFLTSTSILKNEFGVEKAKLEKVFNSSGTLITSTFTIY